MKYYLILAVILGFFACKSDSEDCSDKPLVEGADKISWSSIETDSFLVEYPSDWELDESGLMQSRFFLYAPALDSNDAFRENLNLIAQGLPAPGVNLEMVKMFAKKEIKRRSPNANIESMDDTKLNGTAAIKTVFTGDVEQYKLKFIQYYAIYDDVLYVLTFTAEQDSYAAYEEVAERIFRSFKFLPSD